MAAAVMLVGSPANAAPGDTPGQTTDTHLRPLDGSGSVTILKVDEHGDPLPSVPPIDEPGSRSPYAFFELQGDQGVEVIVADQDRVIDSWPLNDSNSALGAITVSDLPYGTYTITEIYQPDGYSLNTESQTVTIDESDPDGTVTFQNEPGADIPRGPDFDPRLGVHVTADTAIADHIGQIVTFTIEVVNEGNTTLNGVDHGFHRFASANGVRDDPYGDLPGTPETGSGIESSFIGSPEGCVPERYLEPGQSMACEVTYTVTAADLDWNTNNESNDEYDATCNIIFGTWFAAWDRFNSEFNYATLGGDDVRDNPETFAQRLREISGDTVVVPTSCLNAPVPEGAVSWTKVDDADDALLLGGATFTVTPAEGGAAITVTDNGPNDADDADGSFLLTGLPYGDYELRETVAPAGYVLDSAVRSFTIDGEVEILDLGTIVNTRVVPPSASESSPSDAERTRVTGPDRLPETGAEVSPVVVGWAMATIILGLALLLLRRPRRHPS